MNKAHGTWTIPEKNLVSQGYIDFTDDKIEAYFFGIEGEENELFIDNQSKYSYIESATLVSLEGKRYSCFNLSSSGNSFSFFAKPSEVLIKYSCQIVFCGEFDFSNLEDSIFKSLESETENVLNWANFQPYTHHSIQKIELELKKSKVYNYKGLKLFFGTSVEISAIRPSVTITPKGIIVIKSAKLLDAMSLYKINKEISSLISILSKKNLLSYNQTIESKFEKRKIGDKKFRYSLQIKTRRNGEVNIDDWNFSPTIRLTDIDNFQLVLDNWEKRDEMLDRVASVIMLSINKSDMVLDAKYISILSSLESLCNMGEKQFYIDKIKYKSVLKQMRQIYKSEIEDEKLLISLNGRLSTANEISLQSKIIKVINDSLEIIIDRTDMTPEELSKALTDNRNYIAHNDSTGKKMVFGKPETLYWLCEYASLLLLYKYYIILGIDHEIIIKNLKNTLSNSSFRISKADFIKNEETKIPKNAII